jgi:hypothetical protein
MFPDESSEADARELSIKLTILCTFLRVRYRRRVYLPAGNKIQEVIDTSLRGNPLNRALLFCERSFLAIVRLLLHAISRKVFRSSEQRKRSLFNQSPINRNR